MLAGNAKYESLSDLPATVPVFPLSGALLLPRVHMPLNIFEPRYLAMVDSALGGDRLIGITQPCFDDAANRMRAVPRLCDIGGLGRIVNFQETGDGRYIISLAGVCRFRVAEELSTLTEYRICRIDCSEFEADLVEDKASDDVDRQAVIKAFQDFLAANDLEADWHSVGSASDEALVNTLAMMSPYGPAEKQALLEAPTLKARAATLVAITEVQLARQCGGDNAVMN